GRGGVRRRLGGRRCPDPMVPLGSALRRRFGGRGPRRGARGRGGLPHRPLNRSGVIFRSRYRFRPDPPLSCTSEVFLRQLTVRGFKSFADKTVLEFTPGVSVIVGPNGSGKSNIADAVAWVLGEQGPRALRGGQMT